MSKNILQNLYTAEGKKLLPEEIPWNAYPRPQMKRDNWLCLNGLWDFETKDSQAKPVKTRIRVPFCPESLLSMTNYSIKYGEQMKYEKTFIIPEKWNGKRVLLHFGAVNRICRVFVNDTFIGEHDHNAYLPFSFDITDALSDGENHLKVIVVNDLDNTYPYGKQRKKRGGMWYTPCSGIWQTVWLEPVPETYIKKIKISVDLTGATIEVTGASNGFILFEGKEYLLSEGKTRIEPDDPHLWTPEDPFLYEFSVVTREDKVNSYFALRTVSVKEIDGIPRLCLNDKPYFFHALLDQGYYSDGLYTPAAPSLFSKDIQFAKSLGFNTLRKHIKIEPEQFYYECDRLGMIVFQDMVNNGRYRFIYDTALPTIGIHNLPERTRLYSKKKRDSFLRSMNETVTHLFNHPSICCYTVFNEGWGQFCSDDVYNKIKSIDDSRIIDTTSGWFFKKKSDVESRHIYFKKLTLGKKKKPQVLSEFGGYVWKDEKHSFNLSKTYGYKIFKYRSEFAAALRKIYMDEIIPLAEKGLCASVLTQLSDVEDETNGLVTFDRKVNKITAEEMSGINEMLMKAVNRK